MSTERLQEERYAFERRRLVDKLRTDGIADEAVLAAIDATPRHRFVPEMRQRQAYLDHALSIGEGQTISQPYIVARMTELLRLEPDHSVLEIGTGSGYQTAILARLCRRVYSIERIGSLARRAIRRMRALGLEDNVKIQPFDGTVGWSGVGPFDRILVTAGAPTAPPPLLDQLRPGGRLVIPEGDRGQQQLVCYDKSNDGAHIVRETGEAVLFVPLIGRHGWAPEDA
ncbi:MAG: protein-L-isoaspartate(D-aspartate) O-methyltransferase [Acidobacteriota bacterium]